MALFYEAASHFDLGGEPLQELISRNEYIGRPDGAGKTLLHHACEQGHKVAVVALVEAGAALEAQDRDGRTPLHLACLMAAYPTRARGSDHVAITKYLQEHHAATGVQDKYGRTPLSYLPREAKLIGRHAPRVDGSKAVCALETVVANHPVTLGSVAQASVVHMSR
mmetsp:Transcript_5628/g.17534  ORF Transcript_5628/g.17534 Transcript_5628/m.17534 type:complete len:166 (-) Transcript_5628:232-729(-)